MIIYLLFFSVLLLLLLAVILWQGELFSPPVIMCGGFLVSIISAIYNTERWGVSLHWNTYFVIVGGLFTFIVVSVVLRMYYQKRYPLDTGRMVTNQISEILVDNWKIWFLILCTLLISFIYYVQVKRIVNAYKGNLGWTETMHWFRHYVSYGNSNMNIPVLIEQSYQMINFLGYICIFVLINNYVAVGKVNKSLFILCTALLFSSFLNSSRLDLIRYPISAITVYAVLMERKTGKGIKITISTILKFILLFIAICIVFVWLKKIAGRIDDRTPFYYVTYYLGQSIRNLDVFLQETHQESKIWGKETFYGFNHFLGLITGNDKYNYIAHKEFRTYRGQTTGNVYTIFRAYINDFGYVGMIVLISAFSFIIHSMHLKLKSRKCGYTNVVYTVELVFYSYIIFCVYVAFFTNFFWNTLVSLRIIKLFLAFVFWYIFLTKIKIKIRGD